MRSSRGFASTAPNLFALVRLAFASAARHSRLTLLVTVSRRIIMQKARHHSSSGHNHTPQTSNIVFLKAEDDIRDWSVTEVQTCALPIWKRDYIAASIPIARRDVLSNFKSGFAKQ